MTIALAMVLDALLGEPRALWGRWPHPAILFGRAVDWADRRFNKGDLRRLRGVLVMTGLAVAAAALGVVLAALPGPFAEIVVGAILLAQRSLSDHVGAVADALRLSTGDGRRSVAMIVGRDTAEMTEGDVARAAIESAAENLSDGVIAPVFWFLLAGLPGLLVYKVTNTADSMIGYRTARHEEFGWAAARFDDLLNLLPARLTALLIWLPSARLGDWGGILADARRHRSPNAGWPEAAMARRLGVALSGPRSYDGTRRDYPFVNAGGRQDIGAPEIEAAVRVLWHSWGIALAALLVLSLIGGVLPWP